MNKTIKSVLQTTCVCAALAAVISLVDFYPLWAGDCIVIERESVTEAVCNGDPQHPAQKENNNSRPVEYAPVYRVDNKTPSAESKVNIIDSCKMLQANHYDANKNPYVDVEVACAITGKSAESVEFVLHGVNQNGERIFSAVMSGYVNGRGDSTLTKTFSVEYSRFINTHKWEPDLTGKTILLSPSYMSGSMDLLLRITQLKQEASEQARQKSWSNQDIIQMKKGVAFNHAFHQRQINCTDCHQSSSGGTIPGFGKGHN